MKEKERKNFILRIAACVLLVVTAVVMYLTHRAVPFMMDDLWYSTKLSSDTPIANLGDIVESQIWHYQNWGGRSITHGILQITLLLGEQAADVLNVVVTFLLGAVVCLTAGVKRQEQRAAALWASAGMLLGLNANWKMSMFWQAGAANYLYITVFLLLFLHCYLREIKEPEEEIRHRLPGITLWILPLGVLAGWSNENMGPALWLTSLVIIWLVKKEGQKIPLWMILGNLSCLFGSIMVVAAPGNFVRSAQVEEQKYGLLWRLFLRCYGESKAALEYLFPALLLLVIVLAAARYLCRISIGRKNLLLLFCALLSWGAMILSPHYPDRATFGTMVLLICVILSMTRKILLQHKELYKAAFGAGLLIWLRGMFFLGEFLAITWGWIR